MHVQNRIEIVNLKGHRGNWKGKKFEKGCTFSDGRNAAYIQFAGYSCKKHCTSLKDCHSPFLIHQNKRLFISSEGFYALFFNLNLQGRAWQPAADNVGCNKVRQTVFIICRRLSHLTRSLSRIVCRGQEGPKGSKVTLRPNFQANTWPRIFFKSQFHHKIQEGGCKKNKVLAEDNFELMMSEYFKGRRALMNKKRVKDQSIFPIYYFSPPKLWQLHLGQ